MDELVRILVDPLHEDEQAIANARKELEEYLSQFPPAEHKLALEKRLAELEQQRFADIENGRVQLTRTATKVA